jgi:hypothetical protein
LLVQEETKENVLAPPFPKVGKMEVKLELPVETKKKRTNKKTSDGKKIVVSEEVDNKVVEQYSQGMLNIIDISKANNLLVWQVVSMLVNNKIIEKRSDARGYDIYKESDEYKNKINK